MQIFFMQEGTKHKTKNYIISKCILIFLAAV